MNGDDATGKDGESMTPELPVPEPHAPERRSRDAASHSEITTGHPADTSWTQVPPGRRISFTAWGVAGLVGFMLWMVIFKLF